MKRNGPYDTNPTRKPRPHSGLHREAVEIIVDALVFCALSVGNLAACSSGTGDEPRKEPGLVNYEDFNPDRDNPFVLGSTTTWTLFWPRRSLEGWTLEASSPSVLQMGEVSYKEHDHRLLEDCFAGAVGKSDLILKDPSGEVVMSKRVEVSAADRIILVPAGPAELFSLSDPDLPTFGPGDPVRILAKGLAVFRVFYYAQDQVLLGNGALVAEALDDEVKAIAESTGSDGPREWLDLKADVPGSYEVELRGGGCPPMIFPIVVEPEDAVARVEIQTQDSSGLEYGDTFYVLARAFDHDGYEVFGVPFEWELDGRPLSGDGDLVEATYRDDSVATLVLRAGDVEDSTRLPMMEGKAFQFGCTTANAAGILPFLMALAGMGLLLWRIRR